MSDGKHGSVEGSYPTIFLVKRFLSELPLHILLKKRWHIRNLLEEVGKFLVRIIMSLIGMRKGLSKRNI